MPLSYNALLCYTYDDQIFFLDLSGVFRNEHYLVLVMKEQYKDICTNAVYKGN